MKLKKYSAINSIALKPQVINKLQTFNISYFEGAI